MNFRKPGVSHMPRSSSFEADVIRKLTIRIVPFIMLLYFIAYLDRVNIGFASLTMNQDIQLSNALTAWQQIFLSVFPVLTARRTMTCTDRSRMSDRRLGCSLGVISALWLSRSQPGFISSLLLGSAQAGFLGPAFILI